jgi:transcription termination factor Rho
MDSQSNNRPGKRSSDNRRPSGSSNGRFSSNRRNNNNGSNTNNNGGGRFFQRPRSNNFSNQSRPPQRNAAEESFLSKTSIDPRTPLMLEKGSSDLCARAIDLLSPIGKGQRGLIVSPPKSGKTTFLKTICQALSKCDPELKLYTLLIDERPEEVTDFKRSVPGEVFASSNDKPYEEHLRVAQTLMARAVTEADAGKDVVILLDSLTRLSRVHNAGAVGNRTMSGGLDSRAMEIPRRFFGMARNIEEGGSLTILATILVGTGSRMDEVIFQEFKGTGNMELVLSRPAAEQRIFPAINVSSTGTRKEELLIDPKDLPRVYKLRKALAGVEEVQAASLLVEFLKRYPTNAQALASLD